MDWRDGLGNLGGGKDEELWRVQDKARGHSDYSVEEGMLLTSRRLLEMSNCLATWNQLSSLAHSAAFNQALYHDWNLPQGEAKEFCTNLGERLVLSSCGGRSSEHQHMTDIVFGHNSTCIVHRLDMLSENT